jgi:hypothetical protein
VGAVLNDMRIGDAQAATSNIAISATAADVPQILKRFPLKAGFMQVFLRQVGENIFSNAK